jgi:hypothetical protein
MPWTLYGVVGSVMVEGIRRDGVAWLRNEQIRKVAFHALPLSPGFNPYVAEPPAPEPFVVNEDQFRASRDLAPSG